MNPGTSRHERLTFLAGVVRREADHLAWTDARVYAAGLTLSDVASLRQQPEKAEQIDAFVARFGRLQDTLAGALLPRLLEGLLEPVGSVLDNLNRAERLGWVKSASDWARLRLLRNRMVHEYVEDAQELLDALLLAHEAVADLLDATARMTLAADRLAGGSGSGSGSGMVA
ncbi:MAG: hypothetical protein KGJ24_11645 [Burkholderiales bacterium]|nr:hypothetical protein [Burkholderiales bacterium]